MKVGILGLGTVGGGVVNVLQKNSKSIKRRTGAEIELVIAGVRDLNKKRICDTKKIKLTEDPFEVVNHPDIDVVELRSRIGMVFQKPNPFPKSVYDNVAYGPKLHGRILHKDDLDAKVEKSLERAGLWSEVKDRLGEPGTSLSGGQQQRLCIARAIAIDPSIILMDEPCSALDPIATAKIEELIDELKDNFTITIVTHSMQQAARVSQRTAFFHLGKLIEVGDTEKIFRSPDHEQTEAYVTGRYG